MLVKPREKKEELESITVKSKASKKKCLCSKCHKMQTYKEITIPIQYGFNLKQSVLIDGIERVCSVCGWHVDDIETCKINREIAEERLKFEDK